MLCNDCVDSLCGIKQFADSCIVVESVDDVGNVLAHINVNVPGLFQKTGTAVYQVGGKYLGDGTVSISLIELLKAIGEETKGGECEDSLSASLLELRANVQHGLAGGDHIVNDDNVLVVKILTEVLVSLDGVLPLITTE